MTDIRAEDAQHYQDDSDRLPWLEAVDDEDGGGPSMGRLIAFVLIGLLAIGVVVGGIFYMRSEGTELKLPEFIAASDEPYKVKPSDPGGMEVEGQGATAFAASEGADPKGAINTNAVPEKPMAKAPAPAAAPAAPVTAPAKKAAAPTPAPAAGGPAIQLGAFSSQAGATNAWKALSGRFAYLKPLNHSVVSVASGGKTLYRLRATGTDARGVCRRLEVAGENCVVVD